MAPRAHPVPLPLQGVTATSLKLKGLPQHNRASREATLNFAPPVSVKVVGSLLLHTMTVASPTVDLAVVMPAACLHDRDFKNYVYADKRALYLGVLAKVLQRVPGVARVHFETWALHTDKPVLVVIPGRDPMTVRCALRCVLCTVCFAMDAVHCVLRAPCVC